jgi:hypothetical protein
MNRNALQTRFPSFWKLQILGWAIYGVVMYITFLTIAAEGNFTRLLFIKVFRAATGFVLTTGLWLAYRRFGKNQSLRRVTWLVIPSSVALGIAWTFIEIWFFSATTPNFNLAGSLARSPRIALDYGMTVLAWSGLYFGITYWRQWETERVRSLEAVALAHQAQLEMLRYQLNPHFLFNALNSIRASVDEDSRRAKRMITEFSEFLRYSLLNRNSETVRLREEIEAVRNYLSIEKIRFEEKLDVEFDVPPATESCPIPGFLVHPLVENAIKHGLNGHGEPLRIRISSKIEANRLTIDVANTGSLDATPSANGTGTGLDNVRGRLERLYPGRHAFKLVGGEGWTHAVITLDTREAAA